MHHVDDPRPDHHVDDPRADHDVDDPGDDDDVDDPRADHDVDDPGIDDDVDDPGDDDDVDDPGVDDDVDDPGDDDDDGGPGHHDHHSLMGSVAVTEGHTAGESATALGARRRLRRCWSSMGPHVPVIGVMLAYALYYSRLSVEIYRGHGSPGFDLGLYDQGIWLLSRFETPFVTVMGRNLFGDHTSFILLFLVPVYWVYPHAEALLVVQSGAIALGALPVYLLARRRLQSNVLASVLAAAFLLHPALQWGNLEGFHPECFLVPLVGFAIFAAVTWKPRWLIVTTVLALLVKEDVALLIVPLGIWVAVRRDRRFGFGMIAAGVVVALLATQVVMRSLLGTGPLYTTRIPFGGLDGLLSTLLRKPGQVFDYLRGDQRPFYLWQMAFPSALVFVRAPEIAGLALLVLGVNVLSAYEYQHHLMYHYSLSSVPVLALGTVFAIGMLASTRQRRLAVAAVAGCSLYACFLWGALPAISMQKYAHWKPSHTEVRDADAVLAALPPNAIVSADYMLVTQVTHRDRVYQWPTPFQASYWGRYQHEGQRLPFADEVEYLLLRMPLSAEVQATFDQIEDQFTVVEQVGKVALFRRVAPSSRADPPSADDPHG